MKKGCRKMKNERNIEMDFKCDKCICKKCKQHGYGKCDSCNYCIDKSIEKCDNYEH